MNIQALAFAGLGSLMVLLGIVLRARSKRQPALAADADIETVKRFKRARRTPDIVFWIGVWLAVSEIITLVFGRSQKEFHVSIFAPFKDVFGLSVSLSVVTGWVLVLILALLAVLFRTLAFPRFTDQPKGLQNVMETVVETLASYSKAQLGKPLGDNIAAYMFTLAVYMVACAVVELFGQRAPTSDITLTLAMALITFFLINFYGIKQKGIGGRLKSMAEPTPVIFPIRILTDLAIPVSLACRLFGNMLGGMIVMELLYFALGNFAFGLPAVLGLYFNVFHPLIQAFIFITLSLTFINEAIE